MKERSFDEMIAYVNRRVSEMDIAQGYKMELLGMVTALGFKHEKSAQRWIPCSERLPDMHDEVLVTARGEVSIAWLYADGKWRSNDMPQPMFRDIIAWMPLPAPYKEDKV